MYVSRSYFVMKDAIADWQVGHNGNKSIWDRIAANKTPIIEPQNKVEFVAAMHECKNLFFF